MNRGKLNLYPFAPLCNAVLYESKVGTHGLQQHRSKTSEENISKLLELPEQPINNWVYCLVNSSELTCLNKAEKKAYIQKVTGPPIVRYIKMLRVMLVSPIVLLNRITQR